MEPPPRDLPAALAALAPAAMAKPRIHTDVAVRNATGCALRHATLTAKRAPGRKLAVKLEAIASGKRRTVHVAGRAHGWRVDGGVSRCAVRSHHRVSCVVHPYATGLKPVAYQSVIDAYGVTRRASPATRRSSSSSRAPPPPGAGWSSASPSPARSPAWTPTAGRPSRVRSPRACSSAT